MPDKNLSDDMLKLVSYSIVCIEPGREKVLLANVSRTFADSMSEGDFTAWVMAAYCKEHELPCDGKYLRVAFRVLGRWPKPSLDPEPAATRGPGKVAAKKKPPARAAERDQGDRRVIAALEALGGQAAIGRLAEESGLSRSPLRRRLGRLIEEGRVRRIGAGLKTRYQLVGS